MRSLEETMSVLGSAAITLTCSLRRRARWEVTFAGSSSISELKATVRNKASDNFCGHGLRSICWKVQSFTEFGTKAKCSL
jgi:hypothetical protein